MIKILRITQFAVFPCSCVPFEHLLRIAVKMIIDATKGKGWNAYILAPPDVMWTFKNTFELQVPLVVLLREKHSIVCMKTPYWREGTSDYVPST